jgi:hypothetical protein
MARLAAILMCCLFGVTVEDAPPVKAVTMTGQAMLLDKALAGTGVKADAEPISKQVVLKETNGSITPLLSDDASRALFLDGRLRNRRVELQVRRLPRLAYLQVVAFKVEFEGKMRTPEYYCDVCAISVRYPQICPCCQGPMDLRMTPEAY